MAGNVTHFEIRADDAERAQGFWSSLLGWQFNSMPGEFSYAMADTGNGLTAGLYKSDSADRGLLVYFAVDDLDAAVKKVGELGGKPGEKGPVPEMGWFAHCVDSEGNPFGLFQQDRSAA
jgi:predicted enzyme related to lactoylglutathione lyase